MASKKYISMKKSDRTYHQIKEVLREFMKTEKVVAIVRGASADEWANEESCKHSFRRAIHKEGLPISMRINALGKIVLYRDDI